MTWVLGIKPLQAQKPAPAGQPEGWGSTWTAVPTQQPPEVREFNQRIAAAYQTRDFRALLTYCQQQTDAHPKAFLPCLMYGVAYLAVDRYPDALDKFQQAARLSEQAHEPPKRAANALYLSAVVQTQLKDYAGSVASLEHAHRLAPDDPAVLNDLAWVRATATDPALRNGREAVRLARRMAAVSTPNAAQNDTVAAAYAEVGDFGHAVESQKSAIAVAQKAAKSDPKQAKFLAGANARLELYQHAKPYRDEHLPGA